MDNIERIIDRTEEIIETLDYNDIYNKFNKIKYEIYIPSELESHILENFDEQLEEDEYFMLMVPTPYMIKYIMGLFVSDVLYYQDDYSFGPIQVEYVDENNVNINMQELNDRYENHLKLEQEYKNDIENVLPLQNYKGNCSKEFCEKIVEANWEREFDSIQDIYFPKLSFTDMTEEKCIREFKNLVKQPGKLFSKGYSSIIKLFHQSIIYANVQNNLSPFEGWQYLKSDPEVFKDFYRNRLRYSDWYKDDKLDYLLEGIMREEMYGIGLSTSRKYQLVTYFKPKLAKYIVDNYLSEYSTVFDPFSGYSGRMLGVLSTGKNYIGQDACELSVEESNNIYNFLNDSFDNLPNASITVKNVLGDKGTYECLFTCSPYGNIENWIGVESLNYSCDKWIDICLSNYDCDRYVFVTDNNIEKYKKYIKEEIKNVSYFSTNLEYIVVIDKNDLIELKSN